MNVLLIASIPDPRHDPAWSVTADVTLIKEAVRGLAVAAKTTGRTLVVPDHRAMVTLIAAIIPPAQLIVIHRDAFPVLRNVSLAILIRGCADELARARRIMDEEVGVYPVASTGAAALALWKELERDRILDGDVTGQLRHDLVYAPLFERLLSS